MKIKKSVRKRQQAKYEAPALFQDKKLQEKIDVGWVSKKVVNGRYISLLEIKECGWDILCFVKKQKNGLFSLKSMN